MPCIWKIELLIYLVVSDKKIILVGYSGHGLVVTDTAFENNLNVIGYTEKTINNANPYKLEYLGNESSLNFDLWDLDVGFLLGIGDNILREKIYNLIIRKGKKVISLINSTVSISSFATIGDGVFINRNVYQINTTNKNVLKTTPLQWINSFIYWKYKKTNVI